VFVFKQTKKYLGEEEHTFNSKQQVKVFDPFRDHNKAMIVGG